MAASSIDEYLAGLDVAQRDALQHLRQQILAVIPDAEECISYAMPGFRVDGTVVAGFAAFANHLSYFPHSGSTLTSLGDEVAGYGGTKSSLHFSADAGLPDALVKRLIETRLSERDR